MRSHDKERTLHLQKISQNIHGGQHLIHALCSHDSRQQRKYASCQFNANVIASLRYFNNHNILYLITPLTFNKNNVSSDLISIRHLCSVCHFFLHQSQKWILISKFLLNIKYLLKAIKTYMSSHGLSNQMLASRNWMITFSFELSYFSDLTITRSPYLVGCEKSHKLYLYNLINLYYTPAKLSNYKIKYIGPQTKNCLKF